MPKQFPSRKYLQVRWNIPKNIIKELNLKSLEFVEIINIDKIIHTKVEKYFKNNYFDLLSLNLSNVMMESFFKDNEEWIRVWFSSKFGGNTKSIELKRYIFIV